MSSSPEETLSPEAVSRGLSILVEHTKKDLAMLSSTGGEPPSLSHFRTVPDNLQTAYGLLLQGAQLVRATATKYALVGAIDTKDQGNLGADILKGCELVGAASHFTVVDNHGCSGALRVHTLKACLSICLASLKLVRAFHPEAGARHDEVAQKDNTVGAQKTGAVWEACDHVINKMLPQGNRNAMRREVFGWTRDCNDTMEEFQELIDLGPREEEEDGEEDDGILAGFGGDDQYAADELPAAKACLALLKNSRGNLKVALEACEALGKRAHEAKAPGEDADDSDARDRSASLAAIQEVYRHAKRVGEGVTDLGSLLYPPLLPASDDLAVGVEEQVRHIVAFQTYLSDELENLPDAVTELSATLKAAAETRHREFLEAVGVDP
eukprot:CAMPEP_0197182710 /NCGR_PEP_ID=MMETSP1423-20130617/6571_1 /TAXON_ID=476441 /ORGANISM="Pseudo-nitzschia heimii, Strain UNC1101" /LENGTH=381 /DNA_ID=CAMNT_0042633167 /DNA_START=344 /DNA_END=1489 /DNA_ORIENTATION=-